MFRVCNKEILLSEAPSIVWVLYFFFHLNHFSGVSICMRMNRLESLIQRLFLEMFILIRCGIPKDINRDVIVINPITFLEGAEGGEVHRVAGMFSCILLYSHGTCSFTGKPMLCHLCNCYHCIDYFMLLVYIFMILDMGVPLVKEREWMEMLNLSCYCDPTARRIGTPRPRETGPKALPACNQPL